MHFENEQKKYPDRREVIYRAPGQGMLPPQALDFEEAVLGALMNHQDAYLQVSDFLKSECFYDIRHQKIFLAIQELFAVANPIDELTVTQQLRKKGELEMVGGSYYLMEVARNQNFVQVEYHARIVYQKFMQREIIRIANDTLFAGYSDETDVFELHDLNQTRMFELFSANYGRDAQRMSMLVANSLVEMKKPPVKGLTGIGSGFTGVDKFTGGWQNTDLNIIAARPAMGKTALMLQITRNAAIDFEAPVAVFSLEMSAEQLTNRLIANETSIYLEKINKKILTEFDYAKIEEHVGRLASAPIIVDDTPSLTIESFRSKCIRLKKTDDIKLIVIDYLQLMTIGNPKKGQTREQEIGHISRNLKAVAKELKIPVIALSQLSRSVESRPGGGKRPQLSDLRESGSIEQDADNVYFLYRPEYYGITADQNNQSTIGLCEFIIAKNRNGACDVAALDFNGALMQFKDWEGAFDPVKFKPKPNKKDQVEPDLFNITPPNGDEEDAPF